MIFTDTVTGAVDIVGVVPQPAQQAITACAAVQNVVPGSAFTIDDSCASEAWFAG